MLELVGLQEVNKVDIKMIEINNFFIFTKTFYQKFLILKYNIYLFGIILKNMEIILSYNQVLYQIRKRKGMSKKEFAKFLGIPTLFYRYYENGYIKPSSKYINIISEKLNLDYSIYFDGISSYPEELPQNYTRFEKWYRTLCAKMWVKISFVVLLLASIGTIIGGFTRYNYVMNNTREFYNEKYLEFVDNVREKGSLTYSLLHEIVRPEIHISDSTKYVSISASSEDFAIRGFNAYINYKGENESIYYIVPNLANESVKYIEVQYVNYSSLLKYVSTFSIESNSFVFNNYLNLEDGTNIDSTSKEYEEISAKMKSHIEDVNTDFTNLIKEKLGMEYDFYSELIVDHQKGANENLFAEIMSLSMGIIGIGLTGLFLFAILFAIFFGLKEDKKVIDPLKVKNLNQKEVELKKENKSVSKLQNIETKPLQESNISNLKFKEPKKDFRFFPFIPETVFEIIGICLIFLGSVRVILNVTYLFYSDGINEELYNQTSSNLFTLFTVGMFLLYFIDFDIFLDDKRSLRNFFLYGIVFFGLYAIECVLVDYLTKTRGLINIAANFYVVPNNFGTISCYFGIMFFLFYTPKYLTSKKRTVIFRSLSIIPILWIFISTLIFNNYKAWGLKFNTWQMYFFNSERPQFSFLCVTYLVGLFFIRYYFKYKYGEENATKMFNGNKFYFLKNIYVCLIIALIAICEYCLRNTTSNIKGVGKYYQIAYLIPFLLFYHPHLGKRCKPVDYFTLILYGLFFCVGYIFAGLIIIVMVIR